MTLSTQANKLCSYGPVRVTSNSIVDPYHSHRKINGPNDSVVPRGMTVEFKNKLYSQDYAIHSPVDDETEFDKFNNTNNNEIQISINCSKKLQLKNESKFMSFFHNLFKCGHNTRHIGYYSPPLEHPANKINIHLSTGNPPVFEEKYDETSLNRNEHGEDISNSSLKDVNAAAIEDELSSYMEELRLRELR